MEPNELKQALREAYDMGKYHGENEQYIARMAKDMSKKKKIAINRIARDYHKGKFAPKKVNNIDKLQKLKSEIKKVNKVLRDECQALITPLLKKVSIKKQDKRLKSFLVNISPLLILCTSVLTV